MAEAKDKAEAGVSQAMQGQSEEAAAAQGSPNLIASQAELQADVDQDPTEVQPSQAPSVLSTVDQASVTLQPQASKQQAALSSGFMAYKVTPSLTGSVLQPSTSQPTADYSQMVGLGMLGHVSTFKSTTLGTVPSAALSLSVKSKEEQLKRLEDKLNAVTKSFLDASHNEQRLKTEEAEQKRRTEARRREHAQAVAQMDDELAARRAQLAELQAAENRLKEASQLRRKLPLPPLDDPTFWTEEEQQLLSQGPYSGMEAAARQADSSAIWHKKPASKARHQDLEHIKEVQSKQNLALERMMQMLERQDSERRPLPRMPFEYDTDEYEQTFGEPHPDRRFSRRTTKSGGATKPATEPSTSGQAQVAKQQIDAQKTLLEELTLSRKNEADLRAQLERQSRTAASASLRGAGVDAEAQEARRQRRLAGLDPQRQFETGSNADTAMPRLLHPLTAKHAALDAPLPFEPIDYDEHDRTVSPSARLKLPTPTMYRPSHNIEAWLGRMDLHMHHINVHSSKKRALTYASYLSPEAYDRLWKLRLPETVWTDGDALRKQLRLVFGECKTLNSYRSEFMNAKQQTDEVVAEFFDRLYGLLLAAYPNNDPSENQVMQELFASHFIGGLRSATLRTVMLRVQYTDLSELREAAVEHEAAESIGTGQPARLTDKKTGAKQKQQGKSNAAAGQSNQAQASTTEQSDQSKDGKKRSKSKKRGRKDKKNGDNQAQSQSNEGQSDTKPKHCCGHCGKPGHSVDNCWTKDQSKRPSGGQNSGVQCNRCGRMYHPATRCWAEKHVDGHALQPNGVAKPERSRADSNAAQSSNAAVTPASLGSSATMTFLNSGWGHSNSLAVRPMTEANGKW